MNTRPPNLTEICWHRFLDSLSDRRCLIEQTKLMNELLIPRRFIERVH